MTQSDTPPAPPRLDHLSIPVADLERALRFYRDVLGMTLAWRDKDMALVRAGGSDLALNQAESPMFTGRALHFGFKARSIEEVTRWADYLERRGVTGLHLEHGPGVAQLYFQDPDGYTLEIYFPGS